MQVHLQCNDKINWMRMRERGSQDRKKEMKYIRGSNINVYIYLYMHIYMYISPREKKCVYVYDIDILYICLYYICFKYYIL